MTDISASNPTRAQLGEVFKERRTLIAMENLFKQANGDLPSQVAQAEADALAAQTAAAAAQTTANDLKLPGYIVTALSSTLANERVLSGGTGVSIDLATANLAKIVVNVLTILGYTPVNPAAAVSLGSTLAVAGLTSANAGLKVTGLTETDSLRIDQAPTTAAIVQTDWVPININGTTYKLLLGT